MLKVLLLGLLLCVSSVAFAQQEQADVSNEATQSFLAKNDTEKQSILMDLLSVKKYQEAKSLLEQWEKTAPVGKGPSDFLKSYINDLIKAAELKQE